MLSYLHTFLHTANGVDRVEGGVGRTEHAAFINNVPDISMKFRGLNLLYMKVKALGLFL